MSQSIPYGPNAPSDVTGKLSRCRYAFAIPSGDTQMSAIFNSGICRRIYVNTNGTLYLQGPGDTQMTPYTVVAGSYIDGEIVAVGGQTTGTTNMTVNLEM